MANDALAALTEHCQRLLSHPDPTVRNSAHEILRLLALELRAALAPSEDCDLLDDIITNIRFEPLTRAEQYAQLRRLFA